MKLGRLPWQHIPDDEYIASIRKSVRFFDRFRLWWMLFNAGILVVGIWTLEEAFRRVVGLGGGNANQAMLGFSTGAIIGFSASFLMHQIIHNLLCSLANLRSERLLLRFYDVFHKGIANRDEFHDDDVEQSDSGGPGWRHRLPGAEGQEAEL